MNLIIQRFLSQPFFSRVGISLFLLFISWWIFGKNILWLLSIVPFLIQKSFRYIYLLIEIPVAALHKKLGTSYYKISNKLSSFGEKIDLAIHRWYTIWHSHKRIRFGKTMLIYAVCVFIITLPPLMKVDSSILRKGETLYMQGESSIVRWLEKRGWYDPTKTVVYDKRPKAKPSETKPDKMILIASGIKSSLLVKDNPSTNSAALDRLHNGDKVIWTGQMAFSKVNKDNVEPWVKVITSKGVEGWTRLLYLHPQKYENIEFYLRKKE